MSSRLFFLLLMAVFVGQNLAAKCYTGTVSKSKAQNSEYRESDCGKDDCAFQWTQGMYVKDCAQTALYGGCKTCTVIQKDSRCCCKGDMCNSFEFVTGLPTPAPATEPPKTTAKPPPPAPAESSIRGMSSRIGVAFLLLFIFTM